QGGLIWEHPDHCFFLKSRERTLSDRGPRGHAKWLSRQATFTKKIAAPQDCDDRFLPARREYSQLHLALLNVKNGIRRTALRKDIAFLSIFLAGAPAGLRKVHLEVEWRVFFFLCHESAPYLSGDFDTDFVVAKF